MNATPATECFDMTNTPDTFADDLDENTSMVLARLRSGPVDSDLCFDAANTIAVLRAERDTLKARVAELETAQVAAVKPLVWYGKPNNQQVRIGRCGEVSYAVEYRMGRWGYMRNKGDFVCGYVGCRMFESEADAIDGADVDHERRALAAITLRSEQDVRNEVLEAAQVAAVKPLEWNHDPTGYFREYITTHGPAHYYITLETYDTYMLVRHDGRNMGRGGVEDLKALAQELHEKELRAVKGGACAA